MTSDLALALQLADAADALSFAQFRTGLPVETYDERLTSALSQRRMHEVGLKVGRTKEKVDQGAAVALLESYLQRLAARGESAP